MSRIRLLIIALMCFAGLQQVVAQSDVEITDSISNEWGEDVGGGIFPSVPSQPVTSLSLSQTNITIDGGAFIKLTAKVNDDAGDKRVAWSVADSCIALVLGDGVVYGLKTGNTTVTATSVSNPEIKAECSVTVTSDFKPEGWALPDVNFEFFYDAKLYDTKTKSIPNHEAANLAGNKLKISGSLQSYKEAGYLNMKRRCQGYIDKWSQYSTESGDYFYRDGNDCMTIVCKVKPQTGINNSSDLIVNRGEGYNYMFCVGNQDRFFLHTGTGYEEARSMELPGSDEPQVLAVRVDGDGDFIQLDNFTTGESQKFYGVNWGSGNNIMKFFYNDNGEYFTGDVYWMYYSKEYIPDEELKGLISYGMRKSYNLTYIVDGEVYKVVKIEEGVEITPITPKKEGYTFIGWEGLPEIMPAIDMTVTANFNVNYYDVIYMVDGEVYKTVSTAYGAKIVLADEPVKEGYAFSGWSEAPETMPAMDVTITGSFAYTNIHSIDAVRHSYDVYSIKGILLYKGVEDLKSIPKGVYIVDGDKVYVH